MCCDWCCVKSQSVLRAKIKKKIKKNTIKIFNTLIRPVAAYGEQNIGY